GLPGQSAGTLGKRFQLPFLYRNPLREDDDGFIVCKHPSNHPERFFIPHQVLPAPFSSPVCGDQIDPSKDHSYFRIPEYIGSRKRVDRLLEKISEDDSVEERS